MKRRWKETAGFTLVELIVVIAILGILSGVAVPAYSGYVKKANMAADQQLVSDVKTALELYYYSNPEENLQGYVKLGQEGASVVVDNEDDIANSVGAKAMVAVFGEGWRNQHLEYGEWEGDNSSLTFKDSSYFGHESELIGTVDNLTSVLGDAVKGDEALSRLVFDGNFGSFMEDYGVNTGNGKSIGNAAVLYVAQNTQSKDQEKIKGAFQDCIDNSVWATPADLAQNIFTSLTKPAGEIQMGDVAAVAAIYAYAEGFAQATGQADTFNPDFSGVSGNDAATKALAALGTSFNSLAVGATPEQWETYKSDKGAKDLQAYLDMMGTVHNNKDVVSGNLNANDCFTDGKVENLLKGYSAAGAMGVNTQTGEVAVVLVDGVVTTIPADMN